MAGVPTFKVSIASADKHHMRLHALTVTVLAALIFLLSTGCTRTVDKEDDWGNPLGTDPFISQEERALAPLEALEIVPEENWIGPNLPIRVTFNEAVDLTSVETHLWIGDERRTRVNCKYFASTILDTPKVQIELTPLTNLEPGKQYYIYLDSGIRSARDIPLVNPRKSRFIFSEKILPVE